MSLVSGSSADAYDSFAEAYSAHSEASLINGYYMHPAIMSLAGDVTGRRVLDAGCARSWTEEWTHGGRSATMTFWTRPLHAMTDAFTAAGFKIAEISEPPPAADTPRELLPDYLADKPPGTAFLGFIFFVLEAS